MAKRADGGRVRSWAVGLCCLASVSGLGACSSGGGESNGAEPEPGPAEQAPRRVSGADGDDEVQYQLVETADGMTVEAVTSSQVQSFSCPTRSCQGVCDECAARACQAAGELSAACEGLVRSCNESCSCGGPAFSAANCGFPVCTTNRNLCYVGESEPSLEPPVDPDVDPEPGSRPGGGSSAPNGSGAATPAG